MNPKPSSPTAEDAAARSFLSRFEPHGVSAVHGGGGTFIAFVGCGTAVLWLVEWGGPAWVLPLAVVMFVLAVLLASRRVRTRLDVAAGAVVETRSLVFPYRSRRRPVDLSRVREVRLETVRKVFGVASSASPTRFKHVECYAFLEGAVPRFVYQSTSESHIRQAGEYFAVALGVPLRLAEDDVRTWREICEPLRDRLARRLLPAPPAPSGEGRLSADKDEAAGTTRFTLPKAGAVRVIIQPAVLFNIVVLGLLIYLSGLRQGLVMGAVVAAFSTVSVLLRIHGSAVVTVLADGGLEVVRRYPVGGYTRRIAGDDLEDVSSLGGVLLRAEGWQRSIWFGMGLTSLELEWLEHALCLAMAERSESARIVSSSPAAG